MKNVTHRQILAFLWIYLKRYRLVIALMLVLMIAGRTLGIVQPFFYKAALDYIVEDQAKNNQILWNIIRFILLGAGCGFISLTIHEFSSFLLGKLEANILTRVHAEALVHVQRLSTSFHANSFAGGTARKISRGTDGIEGIIDRIWFNFLPLIPFVTGLMVALWYLAPVIGLAMMVGIILYSVISLVLNLRLSKKYQFTDEQDTRVTASLVDTITGNAAVKAFGAESREDLRHDSLLSEWRNRLKKAWQYASLTVWIQFMVLMLIELLVILLGVYLWYRGSFSAGSFIVILLYVQQLWIHLFQIGENVRNYLRSESHTREMVKMLSLPGDVQDHAHAQDLKVTKGKVEFKNVTFRYENAAEPVFNNFSVTVSPGQKIALVGHSGGGKSTLVKLLQRLYDVSGGSILIDNQDISLVTQVSLRSQIGLVPQDPVLFHRTVAENIAYGKPEASAAETEKAARQANAYEFIKDLPGKFDTLVGERGVKLSGGERQRVAIARAILADTPILVLDEATSSLDSHSEKLIQEALHNLMQGRTSIVIAHRLSTIKEADCIMVIEKGQVVETGTHQQLLKKENGVYRSFYELQAGGFIGE